MRTFSAQTRRSFLIRGAALGCSAAAAPVLTPVGLAAVPGDNRLVVIVLRGAMDGLDVVRPLGDPEFAALRPSLNAGPPALPLNDFFALHPALAKLHGLWGKGELGFVHAVSTPYRDKRSHFDGQDLLEAGIAPGGAIRDGWLNRLVAGMPGADLRTAFAVGRDDMLILDGAAKVSSWAPDTVLTLSGQSRRLLSAMYHDEPLFADAMEEAIALAETLHLGGETEDPGEMREMMAETMKAARKGNPAEKLARFTAERLREETRIASFSISGWDTHVRQARGIGAALGALETAILTLRDELGPIWGKTAVLAMTEFGRTARENGSGGTDHGTAGAMILAGGAIRGGRVFGDWPGLSEVDLYQARDLMPTADLRGYAGQAIAGLFGTGPSILESRIFPGADIAATPRIVL